MESTKTLSGRTLTFFPSSFTIYSIVVRSPFSSIKSSILDPSALPPGPIFWPDGTSSSSMSSAHDVFGALAWVGFECESAMRATVTHTLPLPFYLYRRAQTKRWGDVKYAGWVCLLSEDNSSDKLQRHVVSSTSLTRALASRVDRGRPLLTRALSLLFVIILQPCTQSGTEKHKTKIGNENWDYTLVGRVFRTTRRADD